tara:strand:- start:57 stop:266 length:210 start_codon:yes stop_codon:yes gene_type:complete
MKTTFNGYRITILADDPAVRRVDREALKSAGLDGRSFRTQLEAQLELQMSNLDDSRFDVSKTWAVSGLL